MTSAQRKLERGVEHTQLLRREALAYQQVEAYKLRTEEEDRPPEHTHYTCFAIEQLAPPTHWPELAGDAIQNLRSALEHATYAAASRRSRGRVQFPIFKDRCEFQVTGRPMIAGLKEPVRALIEQAQPCNTYPDGPTVDPLWALRELSNLDKHRTLTTVAAAVDMPYVGWDGVEGDDFEFTYVGYGQPLKHDTKVVSFLAAKNVKVDPQLMYEVTVEGRPLVQVLGQIARRKLTRKP